MRSALILAAKDLRLGLRDRSAFIIGILAPFLLAFILSSVLGGAFDSENFSVDFGTVDQDGGEVAATFVDVLREIDAVDIDLVVDLDLDEARHAVDEARLDAAFVIPAGFTEAVTSPAGTTTAGVGPEIQVLGNVDASIATQIATAVADGYADRLDAVRLSVAAALGGDSGDGGADLGALADEAARQAPPVRVAELDAERRELDATTYIIAGMSVLFLFFLVQFGVTRLLAERSEGTLARLLAAPIPRWTIPAAKALTSVALGLMALVTLVVASTVLMGADWGPPAAVVLLGVGVVLAATSIMGIVAAVAKTAEQASNAQAVIAMVLAIVGGSFFPVSQAGAWLRNLATLTPHHWFLRGLGEAAGGGVVAALPAVGALLAFAVVVGAIGARLVPRAVRP